MVNYWTENDYEKKHLEKRLARKESFYATQKPGVNKAAASPKLGHTPATSPQTKKNRDGLIKGLSGTGSTKQPSWSKQKFAGKMNVGDFVSLAGGLSQAIAPDTPQGRVGGFLANYAGQEKTRLKEEKDYERGEKDRGLKRKLTGLQIKNQEKSLSEPFKMSDYQIYKELGSEKYKEYKDLGRKESAGYATHTTDDNGTVRFFDNKGTLLSTFPGEGKYKTRTLYKGGDQRKVYSSKEEQQARDEGFTSTERGRAGKKAPLSEAVKSGMESWKANFIVKDKKTGKSRVTPAIQETLKKRSELIAQEKIFYKVQRGEWKPKYNAKGEKGYLGEDGYMRDESGNKIKREPFTENGTTHYPIPQRPKW